MNKRTHGISCLLVLFISIAAQDNTALPLKIDNPYPDPSPPGLFPKKFAAARISLSESIEFSPVLSPDGKEFYFTRFSPMENAMDIMVMRKVNGEWSDPEPVSFSGEFHEGEPFITMDGNSLYFSSNRPLAEGGDMQNGNIWYVERKDDRWTEPEILGPAINSEAREGHPSITDDGTMYFHVVSGEGYDIYRSVLENGKYLKREKLGNTINSNEFIEGEPAIAPDESYLVFISAGRKDRVAVNDQVCDLYISFRDEAGSWTPAKCMGDKVLSDREENWPWISQDGSYIFFSSNRDAENYFPDIYWVDSKIIEDLKPDHLE